MYLQCEIRNCKIDAALEFLDDIGISPDQIKGAVVAAILDGIARSIRGPKIVSIKAYLTLQAILGVIEVVDLMIDWIACEWDAFFNYDEWTAFCECDCPLVPECNVMNPNDPLGGFIIPNDCIFFTDTDHVLK